MVSPNCPKCPHRYQCILFEGYLDIDTGKSIVTYRFTIRSVAKKVTSELEKSSCLRRLQQNCEQVWYVIEDEYQDTIGEMIIKHKESNK